MSVQFTSTSGVRSFYTETEEARKNENKYGRIVNLLKNNIPIQFNFSEKMLKKYFEIFSTLNPIYIAGLLSKKKKISQLESSMNETAVGTTLKKEANFSIVSNFANRYFLQQFLINIHNLIMNSEFEKSDLVLGADLQKDVENYKKQRFNIDEKITQELVKELFSLLRVMHQKVGEVSKMSDPKLHINQVINKHMLTSKLDKINTIMKDWRHILAFIFTLGVYAIVLAVEKESVVKEISKIDFQISDKVEEVYDPLSHDSYVIPKEKKDIVVYFLNVISKNTIFDLNDSEFTYARAKSVLESPKNKETLSKNTFMERIQCLTLKIIDANTQVFDKHFSGKVFKDYGTPGPMNVTQAVPKLLLVSNDDKIRGFSEAIIAKTKKFEGYEDSLKLKYQRVLDQVAYFDVENDIKGYFLAVPMPLSKMDGKIITKEIIQAQAALFKTCLTKANLVLEGDEKIKQKALERVKAAKHK